MISLAQKLIAADLPYTFACIWANSCTEPPSRVWALTAMRARTRIRCCAFPQFLSCIRERVRRGFRTYSLANMQRRFAQAPCCWAAEGLPRLAALVYRRLLGRGGRSVSLCCMQWSLHFLFVCAFRPQRTWRTPLAGVLARGRKLQTVSALRLSVCLVLGWVAGTWH